MQAAGRPRIRWIAAPLLGLLLGLPPGPAVHAEGCARPPGGEPIEPFLHGTAGASLALLAAAAVLSLAPDRAEDLPRRALMAPAAGLAAAAGAGAGKELLDALGFGRPQWSDFFTTVAGGVMASSFACLLAVLSGEAGLDRRIAPFLLGTSGLALLVPSANVLLERAALTSRRSGRRGCETPFRSPGPAAGAAPAPRRGSRGR